MPDVDGVMLTAADVVRCYAELAGALTRMLVLARSRDWSGLPALDEQCSEIVQRLCAFDPPPRLDPLDLARVVALTTRIRADQDELNGLVRPQLTRLMRNIDQLHRHRRLRAMDRRSH